MRGDGDVLSKNRPLRRFKRVSQYLCKSAITEHLIEIRGHDEYSLTLELEKFVAVKIER